MKKLVKLIAVAALVAAVVEVLRRRPAPPSASPSTPPTSGRPTPPRPEPTDTSTATQESAAPEPPTTPGEGPADRRWVPPTEDGTCPDGYQVKAKTGSRIFHVPGGALYERTRPDRCYASPESAEADGFRASQR